MERITSITLKELSSEKNINIDVHDNSITIITPTRSITINNHTKQVTNGMCRRPKSRYPARNSQISHKSPITNEINYPLCYKESKKEPCEVVPFGDSEVLYREIYHDFIIEDDDDCFYVIGKGHNPEIIPLTADEKVIATNMGLIVKTINK